jgi:small-conductance mechanosensitive channel
MPTPPQIPSKLFSSSARGPGKTRLAIFISLLALIALCVVVSWTTRGSMSYLHGKGNAPVAEQALVDVQPWDTAQTLASLAVTAEENQYARDVERLADHEVDRAFAAALRQARLDEQHRTLAGPALVLSQKIAQLQQLKKQDESLVESLTAQTQSLKGSNKSGAQASSTSDDLEMAKAQSGLDTDELTDAQRDLERVTGGKSAEIQDELAAHETSMRKYDNAVAGGAEVAAVSVRQNRTLAERMAAWFRQRQREDLVDQASQQARNDVRNLTIEHNGLEAKANAAAAAGAAPDRAAQLVNLKDRGIERQILSIDDDRIQTEQQLAATYTKWEAQVKLQHQIVLHLVLQSLMIILLILLGMVVCDTVVRRFMVQPVLERRQIGTLRSILELAIQGLGIVLILIVIFGPPKETPTILGLATAALTIALQDYIIAFLGWFVLMGKNGIHVGDWVEINGVNGEVTEIGLMTTTLIEIGGLSEQGLPTGRRITFMNGFAIRGQFFNFSTAGQWMWDEITMSVPANADVHRVMEEVQKAVIEETHENSRRAEQEWKHAMRDEGLARFGAEPVVHLRPSSSGADLQIRYVTSAFGRFELRNRMYQHVMEVLHAESAAKQ